MKPDPIEDLRLRAYPNPERIGCPGMDVTRALANKLIPPGDSHWQHLWHCSPCFLEFKQLRDARRARKSSRLKIYLAAAAAVLALAVLSVVVYRTVARNSPPGLSPTAQNKMDSNGGALLEVLDYRMPASRGISQEQTSKKQVVTLGVRAIEVLLPNTSAVGNYAVDVREQSGFRVLKNFRGVATTGVDGVIRLRIAVGLRDLQPGQYLLAWKAIGSASWDFGPFSIRKSKA